MNSVDSLLRINNLTPAALYVWELSEEYLNVAFEHLTFPGARARRNSVAAFDAEAERLRIRFLFPGIPEKGLDALTELRWRQWMYEAALGRGKSDLTGESVVSVEKHEASFEEGKTAAARFAGCMTSVQQEILREKFFKVKTEKSSLAPSGWAGRDGLRAYSSRPQ